MSSLAFQAYANESDVLHLDGLDIENRFDRVVLTGDLVLSRDQVGLARLRALHAVLAQALAVLEHDPDLPEHLPLLATRRVPNPFA